MSLIQEALEKAGQSPLSDTLDKSAQSNAKPTVVKKPKPTLPLDVEVEQAIEKKTFQNVQNPAPKSEDLELIKRKKRAGAFVWLFGVSILMIALAACFMLGSEIIHSWQQPKTNREIIQQTAKEAQPVAEAPIASKTVPPATVPDFTLNGITSSGGEQLALINNQIVGVGDRLSEGMVVESIGSKSVILKHHGQKITLRL